jgi:hypothetical protein
MVVITTWSKKYPTKRDANSTVDRYPDAKYSYPDRLLSEVFVLDVDVSSPALRL